MSQLNSTFVDGQMSLETLWRLLEEQRRQNGSSVASVVGLDEAKILVENQRDRHGMTTLGKYDKMLKIREVFCAKQNRFLLLMSFKMLKKDGATIVSTITEEKLFQLRNLFIRIFYGPFLITFKSHRKKDHINIIELFRYLTSITFFETFLFISRKNYFSSVKFSTIFHYYFTSCFACL